MYIFDIQDPGAQQFCNVSVRVIYKNIQEEVERNPANGNGYITLLKKYT